MPVRCINRTALQLQFVVAIGIGADGIESIREIGPVSALATIDTGHPIRSAGVMHVAGTRDRITAAGESPNMATARNVTTNLARQPLAGQRPLFAGEDAAAYDSLLRRVSDVVKPADVLEEIWLQDVVDLSWEVARLRRMKAEFLNSSAHRGLCKVLDGLLGWKESQELTAQWATKNPDATKLVASSLAAAGMTMNTVMAQTLVGSINEAERLDRLTVAAELRRNVVLREIADYRSGFAAQLRRATADIDDAEFQIIPSQAIPSQVIASRPEVPAKGSA